ncbi:MAG TPA: hypothetical protein VN764_00370, partial [Polyangiaceae bacterium]|nr:hypothetical protein [Polyangiaceae bacterium]
MRGVPVCLVRHATGFARHRLLGIALGLTLACSSPSSWAAPEAHILRIDPQTSLIDGRPTLTAVIDIAEISGTTNAVVGCAGKSGDAGLDCMSDALEAPGAWGTSPTFAPRDVSLSVKFDGAEQAAQLLSHTRFGEAQTEPRIGTAYLLLIDADGRVGKAFDELQA